MEELNELNELKELLHEIIERLDRLEYKLDPQSNYYNDYYDWLEETVEYA